MECHDPICAEQVPMTVQIPVDLQDFVRRSVTSGAYKSEGDVVTEALTLLREREQIREKVLAGIAQIEAGQFVEHDVAFAELRRKAEALSTSAEA